MPHAYVATPAPEPDPFLGPPGWNPDWPWTDGSDPQPPGYAVPSPVSFGSDPQPPGDPPPSTYRVESSVEMRGGSHFVVLEVQQYTDSVTPFTEYDDNAVGSGRQRSQGQMNLSKIDTRQWWSYTQGADMYPQPQQPITATSGETVVLGTDPIRVNRSYRFYIEASENPFPGAAVDSTFRTYIYETGWVWQEIGKLWVQASEVLVGVLTKTITEEISNSAPYLERGWLSLRIQVSRAAGAEHDTHVILVSEQWQGSDSSNPYLV